MGRMGFVVAALLIRITTHDANGDCLHQPYPRGAATVDAMMMMAGKRGDEATARQLLQGNNEATRMQRQSAMAPQVAGARRQSTRARE